MARCMWPPPDEAILLSLINSLPVSLTLTGEGPNNCLPLHYILNLARVLAATLIPSPLPGDDIPQSLVTIPS